MTARELIVMVLAREAVIHADALIDALNGVVK